MKALSAAETTALAQRAVSIRNLLWISAKDRTTGVVHSLGFWNDVGTTNIQVYDAYTGGVVVRTFIGAGSLMQVDDVVSTADLTIQEVTVTLSGIDDSVALAVRGYEPRLAPVQLYRLLRDPTTGNAEAPARPRFVGIVDSLTITDPRPGGQGIITAKLVSQMRELTRSNPDMMSDDSQKARLVGDRFYEFSNAVVKWSVGWGAYSVKTNKKDKKDKKNGKGKGGKGK